jgi:hypothetical protein
VLTIFDTDEVSIIISLPGDQDQPQALLTITAGSFLLCRCDQRRCSERFSKS